MQAWASTRRSGARDPEYVKLIQRRHRREKIRMAYKNNMGVAANRHYVDGCKLLDDKRFDNAGYHFGIAAECAIKQKMLHCGVLQDDDAIWKHWPTLRPLALVAVSGRQAASMRTLLTQSSFMQEWDIVMRYAETGSVDSARASRWKTDADRACGLLLI